MRLALLCFLFVAPVAAQTQPGVHQETEGPCSVAISGNNNQVFTCRGIDKRTADQILRILNKIMVNQLEPAAVMAKLEDIQKTVGDIKTATNALDEKILVQLAGFVTTGQLIQNDFIKSNDVSRLAQLEDQWVQQVYDFLLKNVRASTAMQFTNAHGNASMGCPSGHSVQGCGYWQDIQGKRDFLNNLR